MGLAGTNTLWLKETEHSSLMRKLQTVGKKHDEIPICQMIDHTYIRIGNHLFRQYIGIPMGADCETVLICFCTHIRLIFFHL